MSAPPKGLNGAQIAWRAAQDIPEGAYVNLGIGLPELVADHVPHGREIVLHSENGLLGVGPTAGPNEADDELINAGKKPITLRAGAALFHHADLFAMIAAATSIYACWAPSRSPPTVTLPTGRPARRTRFRRSVARWILWPGPSGSSS